MASYKAFVISGLLLVTITIVVQSAPIKTAKQSNKQDVDQPLLNSVDSEKVSSISASTTTSSSTTISQSSLSTTTEEKNDNKKKRYINDDQLDELLDDERDEIDVNQFNNNNDHTLHANIQETSAKIHDNADKPVNTDDSNVFSDIKMTSNELTNVIRRRRNVKLNDESNQRHKRSLSPYDFYDTDSFYDPYADLIERQQYARPTRSFAPIYWYPSAYERNIRSALAPSFYESSEWPSLYSTTVDDDDNDDNNEIPISMFDDENDYESNRYPILLQSSNNNPLDNLQLQQQYNTDDLPTDEDFEQNFNDDDDDNDEQYRLFYQNERPYDDISYEPIENYF